MKNLRLALLCALSLPLGTINAGFGYYAGRVAQGLTRGTLVAVPAAMTIVHAGHYANFNKSQEQIFDGIEINNSLIFSKLADGSIALIERDIPLVNQLKKDISTTTGIPEANIAVHIPHNIELKGRAAFDGNMGVTDFKKADGSQAALITIGQAILNQYKDAPATTAVIFKHEAAHAQCEHLRKRIEMELSTYGALTVAATILATRKINPQSLSALKLFGRSLTNTIKLGALSWLPYLPQCQFFQKQEREADNIALQKTTNIQELEHFKNFFKSTEAHHKTQYSNPISQLFAGHPTPESRIAKTDARIQELQALEDKGSK